MKNRSNVAALALVATLGLTPAVLHAEETKKVVTKESKTVVTKEKHESVGASAEQAELQREAKISMVKARSIAQKTAAGKIESEELEREHGKLIYSFDIRNHRGTIDEVNVDAINGKIVAVEHENRAKEAAEKKQEAAEKTKH